MTSKNKIKLPLIINNKMVINNDPNTDLTADNNISEGISIKKINQSSNSNYEKEDLKLS
jgi:hypothetical protein